MEESTLEGDSKNWFNLSPSDGYEGIGSEKVYQTYGEGNNKDIIVAVLDDGVDVNHEDLQGQIWINPGEVVNNQIDDDGNGYIDDISGWNFLGNPTGNATFETDPELKNGYRLIPGNPNGHVIIGNLELTREVVRLRKLKMPTEIESAYLKKTESAYKEALEAETSVLDKLRKDYSIKMKSIRVLQVEGFTDTSPDALRAFFCTSQQCETAKKDFLRTNSPEYLLKDIFKLEKEVDLYSLDKDPYSLVNDADPTIRNYGNNDVSVSDGHGTHVSGIIGANRFNHLGIRGVANKVKIMAVRVLADGDERDRDVANGIRYAVENGARIINMSFGKEYSSDEKLVDEAIQFAEEHGVLLVHAAGNNSQNIDKIPNFPNRTNNLSGKEFENWLEIAASGQRLSKTLNAVFSNYGLRSVDLYAPGEQIFSLGNANSYTHMSGTSMAAPVAAGAAALILAYKDLNANELRTLLTSTVRRYPDLEVYGWGPDYIDVEHANFRDLSITGGVLDVFQAVGKLLKGTETEQGH